MSEAVLTFEDSRQYDKGVLVELSNGGHARMYIEVRMAKVQVNAFLQQG